jgi:hypothetical protein
MSAGAVFKLIANDGKADRMIMATKLLNQRIKDVMCARKAAGKVDITPTLPDLERTHVLFVNAHFKPYAAIGYEYNKVRPQSGSQTLNSSVTFSIPQFGDFFHDMVARTRLGQTQSSVLFTPVQAIGTTSAPAAFPCNGQNADGTTTADAQGYLGSHKSYNLVDALGRRIVQGVGIVSSVFSPHAAAEYRNYVRYCEYPGNRLFSQVKFDVNGNPLDSYDSLVPVFLTKFCLAPNKVTGFKRLVGQEVPLEGYGPLRASNVVDQDIATDGTFNTPTGVTLSAQGNGFALFNNPPPGAVTVPADFASNPAYPGGPVSPYGAFSASSGVVPFAALNSTPAPVVDYNREIREVVDGPQTPKPAQPPLEIWNKLRFWFNDDVRLSIASVSIPFGQRFITITMSAGTDLIYEFSNLYLETIIEVQGTGTFTIGTPTLVSTAPYQRIVNYTPLYYKGVIDIPAIERMELYVNNIFVNPEVHDIFIKRIGFSLIRVYREQNNRISTDGSGEVLLSQIKWPVEYMWVGMRPTFNIRDATASSGGLVTTGNTNVWRDWHRMTRMIDVATDQRTKAEVASNAFTFFPATTATVTAAPGAVTFTPPAATTMGPYGYGVNLVGANPIPGATSNIGQVTQTTYALPVPSVDSLTVTAHGITIFDDFRSEFFNAYMPFHYGGPNLTTPDDMGALFINFCLFPRSYQPSGHLNISRARETYIRWSTSYVSPKTPADLLVVALCINFLLITDGSAVLRSIRRAMFVAKLQASVCMVIILSAMQMQHCQIAGNPLSL